MRRNFRLSSTSEIWVQVILVIALTADLLNAFNILFSKFNVNFLLIVQAYLTFELQNFAAFLALFVITALGILH